MKLHFYPLVLGLSLAACGSSEPRGEKYFSAHLTEAAQVVADCANGTVRSNEWYNAAVAVSKAKAKERTRKLGGKIKQQ